MANCALKLIPFSLLYLFVMGGCALLKPFPAPISTQERLMMFPTAGLPLNGDAEIYWNEFQIPYIHAAADADVPFLIGMVHAHLRLGQMELLRRVSQGRLGEMFGPWAVDIDHSLRIIDFGKAVPEMIRQLPPETHAWLVRYTEGINTYIEKATQLTPELTVLGIRPSAWSPEEVLTLGRLTSTDVNWLYWFMNMRIHKEPSWPELWTRMKAHGRGSLPSFGDKDGMPVQLMSGALKSGSNAMVVSGKRTSSGSSLIASDPHLGLMIPNFWVIIGYRSPGYQVVGFTIPGLPVILLGRNADIAWGGTNMLSLSSTFYDMSDAAPDSIKEREEIIRVRWWYDRKVIVRDSGLGPVVSDSTFLEKYSLPTLALKWRGHRASDEVTPFLTVNRASTWEEFRRAFEPYAVSGQNMLYADVHGNIGQVAAVQYAPAAGRANPHFFADPADPMHLWSDVLKSTDLPSIENPKQGYLVSTNNPPVKTDPPLALFGNANDRYAAISRGIERSKTVTAEDLKTIQQEVFSNSSYMLAQRIRDHAPKPTPKTAALLKSLQEWDGRYSVDSRGAAALELVAYHLASTYYQQRYGDAIAGYLLRSPAVYTFLLQDLATRQLVDMVPDAVRRAADDFESRPAWGELHVLKLSHPLGNLPLIGGKYRFGEYPAPGTTNTVMKRAHPLSNEKRSVTYGANARHISDLSDPDANDFALVGGQDGYWGSRNYLDLFRLWQKNEYVRVPLRIETVRKTFAHRMKLNAREHP